MPTARGDQAFREGGMGVACGYPRLTGSSSKWLAPGRQSARVREMKLERKLCMVFYREGHNTVACASRVLRVAKRKEQQKRANEVLRTLMSVKAYS